MVLVLKNGEVIEGVPGTYEAMFGARFGGVYVDYEPEDDPGETYEWTMTINGRMILAQEIAEFTVKRS